MQLAKLGTLSTIKSVELTADDVFICMYLVCALFSVPTQVWQNVVPDTRYFIAS